MEPIEYLTESGNQASSAFIAEDPSTVICFEMKKGGVAKPRSGGHVAKCKFGPNREKNQDAPVIEIPFSAIQPIKNS
jgi:hypothetical protein